MMWIWIDSKNIIGIDYDFNFKTLYVKLANETHAYSNVEKDVFINFFKAPSAEEYFNKFVKNQYTYRKIN